MIRVLDAPLEAQLQQARELLATVRDALVQFGAAAGDQTALAASTRQLDELFLLVIVGEFNAGKSAFINALLGQRVLQEGVTPTTAQIQVLKYGETVTHGTDANGIHVVTAPVELLRDVHIVDTPGTNAIIREHERLTTDFVPRSDLVLFITSADRPFTETERQFLATIRDWGKKIVIVVNKVDIFSGTSELDEVLTFVEQRGAGSCSASRPRCCRSAPGWRSARRTASRGCGRRAASSGSSGTCSRHSTAAAGSS